MNDFLHVMTLPFTACLILTGIHAYLGLHVVERQVIFVDLALAQIAALGTGLGLGMGLGFESASSYILSLSFTLAGAAVFSMTRFKDQKVPQEAIIGIVYAVAAAMLVMVLSRSGEGDEHIRELLVGNILLVDQKEVWTLALLYSLVGVFHYFLRKPFLRISQDPRGALAEGLPVRLLDFLFYASFGLVVTSSVRIAGVLLVFAFLIVPASAAMFFCRRVGTRLAFGWGMGAAASILGMVVSYFLDFPTGASVVCVFGLLLGMLGILRVVIK